MASVSVSVVTGAFGYTGRYIAARLLSAGREVRTLTGHPDRENPFGSRVSVAPYRFDDPGRMAESLHGADVLFNTYWVRFPHRGVTFERAVENSRTLIEAARAAGVRRFVHISITNPHEDSPFAYFRGKAAVERAVEESGLSYGIVRPTVVFGREDILVNNIAWLLRRVPVFAVPGDGAYRLRPVYVEDVARLAVDVGEGDRNEVVDAVGPETFAFEDLVRLIGRTVGSRARLVHVPPRAALLGARAVGYLVRDVVVTRDELRGLMAELVATEGPATGPTRLSEWLAANAQRVGRRYASELARHYL